MITGGEPLLQAPALARMLTHLPALQVEIETNGTVAPHPALDPLVHQSTVSPKLAHSGNPADLALIPERLAQWAQDPRAFFKFVIAAPDDVAEYGNGLVWVDRFALAALAREWWADAQDAE